MAAEAKLLRIDIKRVKRNLCLKMSEEEEEYSNNGSSGEGEDGDENETTESEVEEEGGTFEDPSFSLSPQLIANLTRRDLTKPTEVQRKVIPKVRNERGGDVLVNAPTGSGKTLAYALPIIEALSKRLFTALGCVVIVPTRELVQQVREVFEMCVRKLHLKVESAQGQRNFAEEQDKLVGKGAPSLGGRMLVDILITTPGRLAEHILHTPGFTLQHLQFLVLDEADRLLQQSFQNWIELVVKEINTPKALKETQVDIESLIHGTEELSIIGQRHIDRLFGDAPPIQRRVRKLVFSATLTHDIGKLSSLQIHSPGIISVGVTDDSELTRPTSDDAIFTLPTTLHEYAIPCSQENKPLLLLHLLQKHHLQDKTLVFTHSTETATRLTHLLTQIHKSLSTAVISSEVPLKQRKKLLSAFQAGRINVIITTDLLSRGMDIPGIKHVVSYDAPGTARVYVHRAGRTARAGREGDVWCLVTDKEKRWFWKSVVGGIRRVGEIERVKLLEEEIGEELLCAYRSVIEV